MTASALLARTATVAALVIAVIAPMLALPSLASAQDGGGRNGDDRGDCPPDARRPGNANARNGEGCDQEDEEPPPPPPVPLTGVGSPPPAGIDVELEAALETVGFLDTWYQRTPTHPRLSLVAVSSPTSDEQRQRLLDVTTDLIDTRETTTVLVNATQDALNQRRVVDRRIGVVDEELADLATRRQAAIEVLAELDADLDQVLGALREAAVGMYVNDEQLTVSGIDDVETYNQQQELAERVDATIEELLARRDDLEQRIAAQQLRISDIDGTISQRTDDRAELVRQRDALTDTITTLNEEVARLTVHRIELETGLPAVITDTHTARLTATAPGINASMVALDSYVKAAENIVDYYPACGIRWELLAGIATIESAHGTFGGAVVGPTGDTSRRILGPVLDGTLEDTAVINDTDGGRLDGNAQYDRALGPFQFIPGTWRGFALDGDGDGVANPHNMYDGALSAAGYLCTTSNVTSDSQIARSVLAYNQSGKYLADVTRAARRHITSLALRRRPSTPTRCASRQGGAPTVRSRRSSRSSARSVAIPVRRPPRRSAARLSRPPAAERVTCLRLKLRARRCRGAAGASVGNGVGERGRDDATHGGHQILVCRAPLAQARTVGRHVGQHRREHRGEGRGIDGVAEPPASCWAAMAALRASVGPASSSVRRCWNRPSRSAAPRSSTRKIERYSRHRSMKPRASASHPATVSASRSMASTSSVRRRLPSSAIRSA